MFLHTGASLHGHEYSPPNRHMAQRDPLVRASFSAPLPTLGYYARPRPHSIGAMEALVQRPAPIRENDSYTTAGGDAASEDGLSYLSDASEVTSGGTKAQRRKRSRSRTSYQLAQPAPTLTRQQRLLHIRPKLLLQLQQLSQNKRPTPTIDVLPSTVVVPRLMKRFPRMFKGKGELGANDVIIMKSEDYNAPDEEDEAGISDDDSSEREVLAVICQLPGMRGSAEICLKDGSVWYGTAMPKGVFELATTDPVSGERTIARWVPRSTSRHHESQPNSSSTPSVAIDDQKYSFSILTPNSRRHPILATMNKSVLDIPDSYTTVSSSAGRCPPTSPVSTDGMDWRATPDKAPLERTTITVDSELRELIQVTAVWLALRQGWCSYFKYTDTSHQSPTRPASISLTASPFDGHRPFATETRASTPESNHSSFSGVGGKLFRPGNKFRSSPSATSQSQFNSPPPRPQRSVSSGAVFMQRAAARRTGPPSTVVSDSEGEMNSPTPPLVPDTSGQLPSPGSSKNGTSSYATPDSPTRTHHRHSIALGTLGSAARKQHPHGMLGQSNGHPPSYMLETTKHASDKPKGKKKHGKWSSFINFLRHGDKP
jgi:hypothetical protein